MQTFYPANNILVQIRTGRLKITRFLLLMLLLPPFALQGQYIPEVPLNAQAKTKVLVLASPHLAQYKDQLKASYLDRLIALLKDWSPDVVTVEFQPGLSLATLAAHPALYEGVLNQFGGDAVMFGNLIQEQTNWSRDIASDKADSAVRLLSSGPVDIAATRISLIRYSLAAYDYPTAVLQYASLSTEEKKNTELPPQIVQQFEKSLASVNEIWSLGMQVAKASGLQELHGIDDHLDKDGFMKIAESLMADLKENSAYLELIKNPWFEETAKVIETGLAQGDLMDSYLEINSREWQRKDYDLQWNVFFKTQIESGLDRSRVAFWEVRNLNIASNIRRTSALHPGGKILVIIGASHKLILEQILGGLSDLRLVQLSDLVSD